MRHLVVNDYGIALQLGAKAFLISGGIAVGLITSEVLKRAIIPPKKPQPLNMGENNHE